ncbi:MAG: hypothetical protein R2854_24520 [Caldilineaceae bacterium]
MAGWHEDEGGIFNDYQIDELVALIRYVDWPQVGEMAAPAGTDSAPPQPVPEVDDAFLAQIAALDTNGAMGHRLPTLCGTMHHSPRRQRRSAATWPCR